MPYRTTAFRQSFNITDLHLQCLILGIEYHDNRKAAQHPKKKNAKIQYCQKVCPNIWQIDEVAVHNTGHGSHCKSIRQSCMTFSGDYVHEIAV